MADEVDDANRQMKDEYINMHGTEIVDPIPYKKLELIKIEILKQWFKEQLAT